MKRAGGDLLECPSWIWCAVADLSPSFWVFTDSATSFFTVKGHHHVRCSTEISNSPKNIYLKIVQKILIRSTKTKTPPQRTVLGTILCSSSDTNGKSEHYTENVPTTRESISLKWPGPKYSHSFFAQNTLIEICG